MQVRSDTWYDKSTWGDGPWQDEPDRVEWRMGEFVALARRNYQGAWCGYVGVPPGHPWHGVNVFDDGDVHLDDVEVHGGLNYSAPCEDPMGVEGENLGELICHVPQPGEPDDVWWLGFDCGHFMDICPAHEARMCDILGRESPDFGNVYRELAYVQAEVEHLVEQAATASKG